MFIDMIPVNNDETYCAFFSNLINLKPIFSM